MAERRRTVREIRKEDVAAIDTVRVSVAIRIGAWSRRTKRPIGRARDVDHGLRTIHEDVPWMCLDTSVSSAAFDRLAAENRQSLGESDSEIL